MMKLLSALFLSLGLHIVIAFGVETDKKPPAKVLNRPYTLTISKLEVIPNKTNVKKVVVSKKSFHGKVKTTVNEELINKKPLEKGGPDGKKYLQSVRKVILEHKITSYKVKKLKLKGPVKLKIQIQKTGYFDILFIDGKNKILVDLATQIIESIEKFQQIPASLEQEEIQLVIPLDFDFSK